MTRHVIAYQGEPGAYSELAARRLAIPGADYLACRRFEDVFAALVQGIAGKAVVPYVNSLAGPVAMSCSQLARQPVRVLDEVTLRISHALIAPPASKLDGLRWVLSHPVALRQCARFFRRHPWIRPVPSADTAGAVAEIMASRTAGTAAIAGAHCAALYGAEILVAGVEDSPENYTQFLLIEPCLAATGHPPGGCRSLDPRGLDLR